MGAEGRVEACIVGEEKWCRKRGRERERGGAINFPDSGGTEVRRQAR